MKDRTLRYHGVWIPCFVDIGRYCFIQSIVANGVKSLPWFFFFIPRKQLRACIRWHKILHSWRLWFAWNNISGLIKKLYWSRKSKISRTFLGLWSMGWLLVELPRYGDLGQWSNGVLCGIPNSLQQIYCVKNNSRYRPKIEWVGSFTGMQNPKWDPSDQLI